MTPSDESPGLRPEVRTALEKFESALLTSHPSMGTLLRQNLMVLKKYPEQVSILSDEQVARLVRGLGIEKGVALSSPNVRDVAKRRGLAAAKALAAAGEDQI